MKKITITTTIIAIAMTIYLAAVPILRGAYRDEMSWPNGDRVSRGSIGVLEVGAPVWLPFVVLGRGITFGL